MRRWFRADAWKQVVIMIEIKNVSFRYKSDASTGGKQKINLSIPAGQTVVFCGESGCGKTTLTRLINGLIPHFF